jgi:NAD+ diphosphatase
MSDAFLSMIRPPEGLGHSGPAYWFVVRDGEVLVGEEGEWPYGSAADLRLDAGDEPLFLGMLTGEPVWTAGLGMDAEPPDGLRFEHLLSLAARLPDHQWALAGRAVQLVEWERTHRFCGRCGTATLRAEGERARRCPKCGLLAFPRLAPAVIALVEREGKALLARARTFGVPMYSCLAGFVEPGETLEQAVRREVREEVGIGLGEVRYFASQPWPFPHSLMVGFLAWWESGEIVIDPDEIVDAGWFGPDELPAIPPKLSIARSLIDEWLGKKPASPKSARRGARREKR